jgi:hypothetical protein
MAVAPDATGPRDGTAGSVHQVTLRPGARALSTLARIDYHDAFAVEAGPAGDRTGEQWARAVLAGAPRIVRLKLVCGWYALGLKLRSPWSGRGVLGWEVRRSTPDFVLLGAGSRIGMPAELLFMREPRGLLFATFVRQQNRVARAVWARTVPKHQRVVRSLLAQAAWRRPS